MNAAIKNIFSLAPRPLKQQLISLYEGYYRFTCRNKGVPPQKRKRTAEHKKPRILFYHVSGLSFGGTEKSLQILAKYLPKDKYDVFFMYAPQPRTASTTNTPLDGRLSYLANSSIQLIPFIYSREEPRYPYVLQDMQPTLSDVISSKEIDLLVTAGSGYAEYPFSLVNDIPIIVLNIFGSPTMQKNVHYNVCISEAVADKIRPVVPEEKIQVMYIPSERPTNGSKEQGAQLRASLQIPADHMVFGRIGRGSDAIFDPIGIRAFQKIVATNPTAHYLIMSPPPILEKIVRDEHIPQVHFLPPSSQESDIWTFHQAIDVLAHFRRDGESCGLNIAEAMLCGRPVISHRSTVWNAHLEYLEPAFSRIANIDDVDQYAAHMQEFITLKRSGALNAMGRLSQSKAEELFLIDSSIVHFEQWVDAVLARTKEVSTK